MAVKSIAPASMTGHASACLLFAVLGCQHAPENDLGDAAPPNIGQIVNHYMQYAGNNRGVGPRNEQEFKRFLQRVSAGDADRSALGASRLDVLISPRDGEPYIINYGLQVRGKSADLKVVAYEARGHNGRRAVAFIHGEIDEVTTERGVELGLQSN